MVKTRTAPGVGRQTTQSENHPMGNRPAGALTAESRKPTGRLAAKGQGAAARYLAVLCALILGACTSDAPNPLDVAAVGGAVDQHGCRSASGYQWCDYTQRCERAWELAEAQNFDNSAVDFEAFCSGGANAKERPRSPLFKGEAEAMLESL